VLRRELRQLEGGTLSPVALQRSDERLQRLPYIEKAEHETKPVTGSADLVDVQYEIEEGPSSQISGGVGYSERQSFMLNGSFIDSNLFGTGERLSLETVVNKQAAATAEVVGLTDRGTIEVGKKADLNVIDFENLELHQPRSVDDLPAGGRRILQDATGYVATIVSGVVTRRDGVDTGARPGRLVRAGH